MYTKDKEKHWDDFFDKNTQFVRALLFNPMNGHYSPAQKKSVYLY
jgi:hypothetical protein